MSTRPGRLQHWVETLKDHPVQALSRGFNMTRARLIFLGCETGHGICASGRVRIVGGDRIHIGDRATFVGGPVRTELICHRTGSIVIGDESLFNYGASIEAFGPLYIGSRCMMGSFVRICDQTRTGCLPVVIGDDVWLAHGVIVEPGVTIGAGSVVSAGSVVTKDVPPCSLAVGNPARCVSLRLAAPRQEATGPAA